MFRKYGETHECYARTTVELPTTQYKLLKWFKSRCSFRHQNHIFCEICKIFSECSPGKVDEWKCAKCKITLEIKETNYFVYINLEDQLKQILHKHWKKIQDYNIAIENDDFMEIRDTYSGCLIQEKLRKNSNILSLMINTDGISLKKSNKKSAWPVQIICNFLPPQIRYLKENILTVVFSYCEEKPDMKKLFEPFATEMEQLELTGFVYKQQVYRAAVTSAVLDLPAKAAFQQTKQYNGYFGCGFCLHRGESINRAVKYPSSNENTGIREHSSFVAAMMKMCGNETVKIQENGIIGISPAISFEFFDMVRSFGTDHMHSVCIGLSRNLDELWFNPIHKHASYISKEKQILLNRRIRSIKPCAFISRSPRSFDFRKIMKASEHRNNLLYFLPVCLKGIIQKKYLDHYNLLSTSVYKLLSTSISSQVLYDVERDLKMFVQKYQELYGKEHMTMNVHLLTHLVFCVQNLGPLWSQSMFSFESNNATFSRYVRGNTDITAQMSTRYMLDKSTKKQTICRTSRMNECLSVKKKIKLSVSEKQTLNANRISYLHNQSVEIYCVYQQNHERFTSMNYSAAKKTIDYVVELNNNILGKIKFYFKYENLNYMMLEEFEIVEQVNHIKTIKSKNAELICLAETIKKKFIYINFVDKHYVTERPNVFESD